MAFMTNYQFFLHYAGYSHKVGASKSEAYKARCANAKRLADAEREAQARGLVVYWSDSQEVWDGDCEPPVYCFDGAVFREEDMQGDYPLRGAWALASLGMVGVDLLHDPYLRVCAAELFVEALATLDVEAQAEADKLAVRATYAG